MIANADLAQHILIFGAMVVALGGGMIGILRGWNTVVDQMKRIVLEHEQREEKKSDEREQHQDSFRYEVLNRLDRVEAEVQYLREHLIATNGLPILTPTNTVTVDTDPLGLKLR